MKKKVFIYQDEGVCPNSYLALKNLIKTHLVCNAYPIDAKTLKDSSWKHFASTLIFPGGRDIPYQKKLSGIANDQIRDFVETGGNYIGICAGAYYAAKKIEFEKDLANEICEERELGFFEGTAIGSLYANKFDYFSQRGAHASYVSFLEEKIFSYYNGGCRFDLKNQKMKNTQIIGKYLDIGEDFISIVLNNVGKGKVFLSGVHLEHNAISLKRTNTSPKIIKKIEKTQKKLDHIWKKIFKMMKI